MHLDCKRDGAVSLAALCAQRLGRGWPLARTDAQLDVDVALERPRVRTDVVGLLDELVDLLVRQPNLLERRRVDLEVDSEEETLVRRLMGGQ